MKFIRDEKGIALVTSLMLTLITLSITMVMLYLVIQNTQLSGAQKRYKNSLDAATGGLDIVTMEALPALIGFAAEATTMSTDYFKDNLSSRIALTGLNIGVSNTCLQTKLLTRDWGVNCTAESSTIDPKQSPDLTFDLQSNIPGSGSTTGYRVYTKIVATTPGTSDMSGRDLRTRATGDTPADDIGSPYLYRIEVASEKNSNAKERANLSVLYAY